VGRSGGEYSGLFYYGISNYREAGVIFWIVILWKSQIPRSGPRSGVNILDCLYYGISNTQKWTANGVNILDVYSYRLFIIMDSQIKYGIMVNILGLFILWNSQIKYENHVEIF